MKPINLIDHPEGGRFQEVFRSSRGVTTLEGTACSALTHIYFALEEGECSLFHKVSSDEVWNLYRGEGIKLYTWNGSDEPPVCTMVSAAQNRFCHVVPAGIWQAAAPISGGVLVGCSVAPGFEFAGFHLLDPSSGEAGRLLKLAPEMLNYIKN